MQTVACERVSINARSANSRRGVIHTYAVKKKKIDDRQPPCVCGPGVRVAAAVVVVTTSVSPPPTFENGRQHSCYDNTISEPPRAALVVYKHDSAAVTNLYQNITIYLRYLIIKTKPNN